MATPIAQRTSCLQHSPAEVATTALQTRPSQLQRSGLRGAVWARCACLIRVLCAAFFHHKCFADNSAVDQAPRWPSSPGSGHACRQDLRGQCCNRHAPRLEPAWPAEGHTQLRGRSCCISTAPQSSRGAHLGSIDPVVKGGDDRGDPGVQAHDIGCRAPQGMSSRQRERTRRHCYHAQYSVCMHCKHMHCKW